MNAHRPSSSHLGTIGVILLGIGLIVLIGGAIFPRPGVGPMVVVFASGLVVCVGIVLVDRAYNDPN